MNINLKFWVRITSLVEIYGGMLRQIFDGKSALVKEIRLENVFANITLLDDKVVTLVSDKTPYFIKIPMAINFLFKTRR